MLAKLPSSDNSVFNFTTALKYGIIWSIWSYNPHHVLPLGLFSLSCFKHQQKPLGIQSGCWAITEHWGWKVVVLFNRPAKVLKINGAQLEHVWSWLWWARFSDGACVELALVGAILRWSMCGADFGGRDSRSFLHSVHHSSFLHSEHLSSLISFSGVSSHSKKVESGVMMEEAN